MTSRFTHREDDGDDFILADVAETISHEIDIDLDCLGVAEKARSLACRIAAVLIELDSENSALVH